MHESAHEPGTMARLTDSILDAIWMFQSHPDDESAAGMDKAATTPALRWMCPPNVYLIASIPTPPCMHPTITTPHHPSS